MSLLPLSIRNSLSLLCVCSALNLARLPVPPRPLAVFGQVAEGESFSESPLPSTPHPGEALGAGYTAVASGSALNEVDPKNSQPPQDESVTVAPILCDPPIGKLWSVVAVEPPNHVFATHAASLDRSTSKDSSMRWRSLSGTPQSQLANGIDPTLCTGSAIMQRTSLLIVTAALAVGMSTSVLSSSTSAAGPFGLFNSTLGCCDSGCCDSNSCDADGCCTQNGCCAEGCDSDCCDSPGCDSCCDSRGYQRCSLGDLLGSFHSRDCDCCRDPCSYCSIFGGWNTLNDYSGEAQIVGPPPRLRGSFSDGWMIGLAKGRRFNRAIRGELELAFRSNTADQWSVNGVAADWSGHLFGYTAMANLYHDFKSCELGGITPYVGAGIGLAILDGDFQTSLTRVEIEDAAFAYQFIVGGSKKLNRDVELFTEYRYFGTTGFDLVNVGVAPNVQFGSHEAEIDNLLFGVRINR